MDIVIEGDNASVTISWFDKVGVAEAPISASYRINDIDSGEQIRGDTSLSATETVTIELTQSDNQILDSTKEHEGRRLTATAVYGTDDNGDSIQKTVEYDWQVAKARFKDFS